VKHSCAQKTSLRKSASSLEVKILKIKICGLTNVMDAMAAVEDGADMLGFNFYPPSPRSITIEDCAEIVARIRQSYKDVILVGVFVNESIETIKNTLTTCDLQYAQLHGDEMPSEVEALGSRAYKAIRPKSEEEARSQFRQFAGRGTSQPALLLDAYKLGSYGGTGEVADWGIAAELARSASLLLAGGLTPQNILAAIDQVHPWGVDVASGVESAPGKKDVNKIKAFIQSIRTQETEKSTC
jgi:phosphoribosylanthranilate isomerase